VSDFNSKFKFVHFCDASDFEIDVRLKVSRILLVQNKRLHLILEDLNVFEGCVKGNVHEQLLSHGFRPGNVLDPDCVEHNVRDLSRFVVSDSLENGE